MLQEKLLKHCTSVYVALHAGTQTPRPMASTMGVGAEPNKGHLQDALLGLGAAHTHFGHVQVCLNLLSDLCDRHHLGQNQAL